MKESSAPATKKRRYNATLAMAIAMVAGVLVGAIAGPAMGEIQFIGDIFFRLVQMGIVRLSCASSSRPWAV